MKYPSQTALLTAAILLAPALHASDAYQYDVNKVKSRYGKLTEANTEDAPIVLRYQGKTILDLGNPPGYSMKNHEEDFFASGLGYGKTYRIGEVDVIPVYGFDGGNGQRQFPHFIIAIKPDKTAEVYGNEKMMSRKASYKIKGKKFVADYMKTTVIYDGKTFTSQPKAMKEIPDDICRGLYENIEDLREGVAPAGEGQYGFSVDNITGGWLYAASSYQAFDPKKIAKAAKQKKISYPSFKTQACR